MAELLVRVVDKINDDPYLDAKCLKAGDVVWVCPDGWGWSAEELSNPDWRILKVPGVTVNEAQAFMGPEFDTDPQNPSLVLRRRAFYLDLTAPQLVPMLNPRPGNAIFKLQIPLAALLALKKSKTPLNNPNQLGGGHANGG